MKAQFKPENYQPSSEEHRKTVELMRNHKRAEKYENSKRVKTLNIRGLI